MIPLRDGEDLSFTKLTKCPLRGNVDWGPSSMDLPRSKTSREPWMIPQWMMNDSFSHGGFPNLFLMVWLARILSTARFHGRFSPFNTAQLLCVAIADLTTSNAIPRRN
jgi:hypothetical protein